MNLLTIKSHGKASREKGKFDHMYLLTVKSNGTADRERQHLRLHEVVDHQVTRQGRFDPMRLLTMRPYGMLKERRGRQRGEACSTT